MNENVIILLRNTRTGLQILAEPIDHLARFMNYKKGYPPLWIRQKVGSLNDFEGSGGEYMAYLKLLCGLQPGMNVLDIGCGCGLICLPINENGTLPEYLGPSGRYVGIDIDRKLIGWCNKNIRSWEPNCQFITSLEDLHSYKFDVILAKSLFTHLLVEDTENYLSLIKERLTPSGKALVTFFLMNEIEPKGRYTFKYANMREFYERGDNCTAAVAYKESWIKNFLEKLSFSYDIHYGSWRGDKKGLSFQDILILKR